ncbi:uncharacterized protein LOC119466278 [Dermacentor silvarum]|uniref:uncharacterized protein LOC119466278 n=1 Tax=Dermacentor silvarum TaxID=543639 RepID=UPI0018997257|nr:uncharacterized protein LOC119466278 [Dermacentor silvarum]
MQNIFVVYLCLSITFLASGDEVEDVAELIEESVREHAGSDELAEKILAKVKAIQECAAEHPEDGLELLKKLTVPITKEGTKCAATKSDIEDTIEREDAVRHCFREVAKRIMESTPLTEKETAAHRAIRDCVRPKWKQ